MMELKRNPIIVRVWDNDFGIPSVDPECLHLMLLFKFTSLDVKFKTANFPLYKSIPSVQFNHVGVTKNDEIYAQLEILSDGLPDSMLAKENIARNFVFKEYFLRAFVPAFIYDCWINPVNFEHTTKTWYKNAMIFPLGYIYSNYKCMQAHECFKSIVGDYGKDASEKLIPKLYYEAQCCLHDISSLLAKDRQQYFFGEHPSTFDALIYSYLAVALYLPFPEPFLQNLIRDNPVLVEYVSRMTKHFFPDIKKTYKYIEPRDITFEAESGKTVFIAGIVATAIMVAYAWNIGLLTNMWIPNIHHVRHFYEHYVATFFRKISLSPLSK